jgi:sodium transport system permease protein
MGSGRERDRGQLQPARIWFLARGEGLRLLRDRKAVFFALVLPLLAYPLLFWGSGRLEEVSAQRLEEQVVRARGDLGQLPPPLAAELRAEFEASAPAFQWLEVEAAELHGALEQAERAGADPALLAAVGERALAGGDTDLWLQARSGTPPRLLAFFRGADEAGREGAGRVEDVVERLELEFRRAELDTRLGGDPGAAFGAVLADVASATDSAGLLLGKLLPLVAIFVIIGSGAFAALEAFAAEREVGTLETLLVQPVPRLEFAYGKFLAVLLTALCAWAGNTASFLACGALGWVGDLDLGGVTPGELTLRLLTGSLVFLPTVLLLAGALTVVSARARSYREGQHYLLPLTLVAGLLAAPVAIGDVEFGALLATVPVLGPSLALREALAGALPPGPTILATLSSLAYAALALRAVAATLDAERLLQGADVRAEAGPRRWFARRTALYAALSVVLLVGVGGWLQARALIPGLLFTLWGLALGLAWYAARELASRAGQGLRQFLGLTAPVPWLAVVGALLLGPALARVAPVFFAWQQRVLPMPQGDAGALEEIFARLLDQPLVVTLFLLAITPALCEELLFRGALLAGFRRDLSPTRAICWQALAFAAAHGSLFRLPTTFALGALLGLLRWRSGSLWPCVALHFTYNGALVLGAEDWPWLPLGGAALLGTVLLSTVLLSTVLLVRSGRR